jgi:hypothetical protein
MAAMTLDHFRSWRIPPPALGRFRRDDRNSTPWPYALRPKSGRDAGGTFPPATSRAPDNRRQSAQPARGEPAPAAPVHQQPAFRCEDRSRQLSRSDCTPNSDARVAQNPSGAICFLRSTALPYADLSALARLGSGVEGVCLLRNVQSVMSPLAFLARIDRHRVAFLPVSVIGPVPFSELMSRFMSWDN